MTLTWPPAKTVFPERYNIFSSIKVIVITFCFVILILKAVLPKFRVFQRSKWILRRLKFLDKTFFISFFTIFSLPVASLGEIEILGLSALLN
jgi:hypothetical protein